MSDHNCTNEGKLATLISDIKTLVDRMDKTENKTDQNTRDIQTLKENNASYAEKFERVFELLTEIKDELKAKNERLPILIYSVVGMVIGGSISGVIVWLITK